jgi:outer membrane receptor protein involved in Fe transport
LQGKAILLFAREHEEGISTQESVESTGARLEFKEAREEAKTTETIARLEFDWSGWTGHALSADIEGAYNVLDNALAVTENSGAGAVIVDVPNGNSRIEEVRGDILFNDIWSPGRWSLDYGLGAEVSTLTQTGDADQQRTFIYIKPKILLSFTPNPFRQSSLRLEREVAQLNFNDFVSTTVFVDNDLALGNPNLKPETTWIAELTHERRFGAQGVVSLKGFHHWIKDVMDLLPVSDKYEVPGNVGDGRRWGMEAAGTMPLDWLNLAGARLNIKLRWQDSAVKDPVTGEDRRLSADGGFSGPPTIHFRSDNEYVVDIAFRQDRENSAWAWGWDTAFQADRTLFRVNELERFEEGVELNSFVETTRWLGMKIRLEGRNLLDYLEVRDRLAYAGRRGLSAIQRRELRLRKPGRIFTITFSGVF